MVILTSRNSCGNPSNIVVLVGVGLIGSAIFNSLVKKFSMDYQSEKLDWDNDATHVQSTLIRNLRLITFQPEQIDWVWSAGKAGFLSTLEDAGLEMTFFESYVNVISDFVNGIWKDSRHRIHFVSSAGGLFEGKTLVDGHTVANPLRPYGELKLKQEIVLKETFNSIPVYIYRLANVFGYLRKNQRKGLIATLISNTLTNRITYIYGRSDTLRDYVWAEDVGDYISNKINSPSQNPGSVCVLASARPRTIHEITNQVKKITKKKSLVYYRIEKTNVSQITFSPSVIPADFHSGDFYTHLRKMVSDKLVDRSGVLL